MRVLIADDEQDMLKILKAYFEKEGFQVLLAKDGEEALEIFYEVKIDLAILDWMMPKRNGITVCQEIKKNSSVKVLMLTAKSENEDELAALQSGADEYVKKPFHPGILLTRAKKLLNQDEVIQVQNLKIDLIKNKVYKSDKELEITKTELELIKCFLNHKGTILTRKKLLDIVWGFDYFGDERTVDTHVRRLRKKIGEDIIKTHRGLGYSLEDERE
ncbi:response regulator transcription factor [Bacillus pseudomycoides]|uniref:DNA-binding response regulator n=7 Tax=Bacillus pseudomycoides TaxID=64104 RepID=A0A2A8BXW0_9BACI|nr:response regulator transcription factor [Bacillus pseudomycoides]PDY46990.1 DNA-binding response regulator [Bacillus pseudomycoides]PEA82572.1 DNA-binding response regulator [Bacillus pseudomycoides]PED05955.1 DNA-binding response regulator [Bacillus pseudomycoides]PED70958.1 DNA-binding response regulator [Bacillus pseudomycoides]PEE44651.1 DNA-binding response regulator [Bacillus pseudomycoides]